LIWSDHAWARVSRALMFCACDGFIWATTLRNCSKVSKRGHPCLTWGTSGRAPAGAVAVERSLHEGFFARFGLSEEDVRARLWSPQASPARAT
jgi:hypothetical protein